MGGGRNQNGGAKALLAALARLVFTILSLCYFNRSLCLRFSLLEMVPYRIETSHWV
jgi:hypothetical protein